MEQKELKVFDSRHIGKGCKAYAEHWLRAMRLAVILAGTAFIAMVHAFVPIFLVNMVSLVVQQLHKEMNEG
jgi:hypothetical protein